MRRKQKATKNLESIADKIRLDFSTKDAARENALRLCREIIRCSASAIRTVHRRESAKAKRMLNLAHTLLRELNQDILQKHNDILHSGFVHDAQKEFAEASATYAIVTGKVIPAPEDIGVSYPAYLNGLGEAVGELRRHILDNLRRDDLCGCEELLSIMDDIYAALVTMDFPEGITYGLRRTTDSVRAILERTRGELTLILKQREFAKKLEQMTVKERKK